MTARMYDLAAYRKRNALQKEWDKLVKEDELKHNQFKLMCISCEWWGMEKDVNKMGCTHKYRTFFEDCPIWRKP